MADDLQLLELPPPAPGLPSDAPPGAVMRLSNGTYKDARGRFITPPTAQGVTNGGQITHADARALNARRYELARQRAAAGMVQAVVERGGLPAAGARPTAAWRAVVKHATDVMLDADSPRAMSDLARFIGQSAGMLAADRSAAGGDNGDNVSVTVNAPADVVLAVLAELQRRRSGDLG